MAANSGNLLKKQLRRALIDVCARVRAGVRALAADFAVESSASTSASVEIIVQIDVVLLFVFIQAVKADEMRGPVYFVVEVFRVLEDEPVLGGLCETQPDEIVVPDLVVWHHEESVDFVR